MKFGPANPMNATARLFWFEVNSHMMTDYSYWFILSTIWVEFTGWTSLDTWRKLFSSDRPDRDCLMKPSELEAFKQLPEIVTCYRAHREKETQWLSYTLEREIAEKFLAKRPGGYIKEYKIPKADILCLFLRRQEKELLCLKQL